MKAHTVVVTAANVANIIRTADLLHGEEAQVRADTGYSGVEKRSEITARKRRIETGDNLAAYLTDVESTFVVLPIVASVCLQLSNLPAAYPRDPVDQVIGATALAEGIPLVTADERIRKAKAFETIW